MAPECERTVARSRTSIYNEQPVPSVPLSRHPNHLTLSTSNIAAFPSYPGSFPVWAYTVWTCTVDELHNVCDLSIIGSLDEVTEAMSPDGHILRRWARSRSVSLGLLESINHTSSPSASSPVRFQLYSTSVILKCWSVCSLTHQVQA